MAPRDLIKTERNKHPQLPEGQLVWIPPGYALATEQPAAPASEAHLWDYLHMLWRKRWLIVLVFLISVSLAIFKNHKAIPIYQATAKIRIEPDAPKIISFQGEEVRLPARRNVDFISTQMQIMTSRRIAEQAMEKLRLFDAAPEPVEVAPGPAQLIEDKATAAWDWAQRLVGLAPPAEPPVIGLAARAADPDTSSSAEIAHQMQISGFLKSLAAKPVEDTEIVEVSFASPTPRECARIVNAVCESYINWTYESKVESYDFSRKWLKEKMDEMKAKLEQSENDLLKLTGGKEIYAGNDGQLPSQLEDCRQKIAEAERELFQKEYELQRFTTNNYAVLASLNDSRLNKILDAYSAAEVEYDKISTQLGPNSNEVRTAKAEMNRLEIQLREAFAQARSKAQFDFNQAKANHDYLTQRYEGEKSRISEVQKNMIQYNILKREVDVNRELYNNLLQRWKEVSVVSGMKAGFATLIESAQPPLTPVSPNKPRTLLMGALLGLVFSIGLVFFLDYMDTSVKDPEELERLARLSVLGFVAHCEIRRARGESRLCFELLSHFRPRSEFAESIRSIRTSIQYSRAGGAPKVIMVTSCLPNEGKTTIATNLAISLASRNKRVLLVDADLKRPSLNRLFTLDRKFGLTEVLTGRYAGEGLPETDIPNLFVMPAGAKAPNPVELLDSDVMRQFLEKSANDYDHVIIDTCPSLNMADTAVLAPYVDGVLLVVQPGKTPREAVRRVRERLEEVQGNMLGLVVNNPTRNVGDRYGYRYGYGYGGYGYGYGYGGYGQKPEHAAGRFSRFRKGYGGDVHSNGRGREIVDIVASAQGEDDAAHPERDA